MRTVGGVRRVEFFHLQSYSVDGSAVIRFPGFNHIEDLKNGCNPTTLSFKSCESISSVVSLFLSCSRASSATERLISDTGFVIPAT